MANFKELQALLDRLVDKEYMPGTGCIVIQNGKIVFEHYHGFADIEGKRPVERDTIHKLFSMTKVFTNTAILQLYERGLLTLSDPVSNYIPEFKDMTWCKPIGNGSVEIVPCTVPIRIIDLCTMSAGLTYGWGTSLADRETNRLRDELEKENPNYSTLDFAKMLAKAPLLFEPATHWNYSYCHDVLGALIEVVSGKNFETYLKENIFEPLGISDTSFHPQPGKEDRVAKLYVFDPETKNLIDRPMTLGSSPAYESGGAGLSGTIMDYATFADALTNHGTSTNGVRILGRKTVDLMRTNCLDEQRLKDNGGTVNGFGYGIGVRTLINNTDNGNLDSIGSFGWSGAAGTHVIMDPSEKLTMVYVQQRFPSNETDILPRLRATLYGAID